MWFEFLTFVHFRCSIRNDCAEATSDPLYWLSYKSGKCTTISNVNPAQIQRTTTRTVCVCVCVCA